MYIKDYQIKANRTINDNISESELIESCALGLAGEVGKLCSIINSDRFKGFDCIDEKRVIIADILGDMQWYLSAGATSLGMSLDDICKSNIEKLEKEYPHCTID